MKKPIPNRGRWQKAIKAKPVKEPGPLVDRNWAKNIPQPKEDSDATAESVIVSDEEMGEQERIKHNMKELCERMKKPDTTTIEPNENVYKL